MANSDVFHEQQTITSSLGTLRNIISGVLIGGNGALHLLSICFAPESANNIMSIYKQISPCH